MVKVNNDFDGRRGLCSTCLQAMRCWNNNNLRVLNINNSSWWLTTCRIIQGPRGLRGEIANQSAFERLFTSRRDKCLVCKFSLGS